MQKFKSISIAFSGVTLYYLEVHLDFLWMLTMTEPNFVRIGGIWNLTNAESKWEFAWALLARLNKCFYFYVKATTVFNLIS